MAASSVTGSGSGSASNIPFTNTPQILAAGQVITDGGGGATVEFDPPLPLMTVFITTAMFNISPTNEARVGWAESSEGIHNITIIGSASAEYFWLAVTPGRANIVR